MPGNSFRERSVSRRAERTGVVEHDVVVFIALLRSCGVRSSPAATLRVTRALTAIQMDQRRDFEAALRCCLVSSQAEQAVFDTVFEPFWWVKADELLALQAQPDPGDGPTGADTGTAGQNEQSVTLSAKSDTPELAASSGRATYSRSRTQGPPISAVQRREVDEQARRLARALGTTPGRRTVAGGRPGTVDVASCLRHNLSHGAELLELRYRSPRRNRTRLAVLCDISSSMRPHTALFLAFVQALSRLVRRVETAVFNVELIMVTELFRQQSLSRALATLHRQSGALAGGTRIGHCLKGFLDELDSLDALRRDTVVLILSDGWDVGEPELLADQCRRLAERVDRVLWCDPHAAATGFAPEVQGLRIALPYVSHYLDFSDQKSLAGLVDGVRAAQY